MIPCQTLCPACMEERYCLIIPIFEELNIRGENISVTTNVISCVTCGEEFHNSSCPNKSLEIAFESYRIKHRLLQPQEIQGKRSSKGFSQEELAEKSDIEIETLRMYEEGLSLITFFHNRSLREILD